MNSKIVGEHMIKFPFTAEWDISVTEALALMKKENIRHLPVVNRGELIGVVSERDLLKYQESGGEKKMAEVMTAAPYCVRVGTPLKVVVEVMARRKIGCTIIVSSRHDVLGVFTTTDAVRLLYKLLSEHWDDEMSAMDIEDIFKDWDQLDRWPDTDPFQ